ncbi:MAG: zinc-ribbon domain-containing protein [Deltaproteobacteria bacterium]|nr:zinc-ribbon domain-containing protein [Deltaproteobacteria bacterium]
MIVSCEQCNASFNLNESLLKPLGSMVRCSKCSSVFMAYPPAAQDEPVTLTEVVPDPEAEEVTEDAVEELDLGLDLGAEEVTEDAVEELDLGLDLGAEEEKAPETAEVVEDAFEELDLDFDLGAEEEKAPETAEVVEDAIEDLELELDMDMEMKSNWRILSLSLIWIWSPR